MLSPLERDVSANYAVLTPDDTTDVAVPCVSRLPYRHIVRDTNSLSRHADIVEGS
jgi:hypothetical protein